MSTSVSNVKVRVLWRVGLFVESRMPRVNTKIIQRGVRKRKIVTWNFKKKEIFFIWCISKTSSVDMVWNFLGQYRYCLSSSRGAELFKRRFINPGVAVNFQFNFIALQKYFSFVSFSPLVSSYVEIKPNKNSALIRAILHEKIKPEFTFNPRLTYASFRTFWPSPQNVSNGGLNRAQQGSSSGENFSVEELCPRVKLHGWFLQNHINS